MTGRYGAITDDTRAAAVRYAAEHTDRAAAERYGVTRRTIIRWRQAAGVRSGFTPRRGPIGSKAPHGTVARYRHENKWGGPTCPECRAAWSAHIKAIRAPRPLP